MFKKRWFTRLAYLLCLLVVALIASACYKDAGENAEPTVVRRSDLITPPAPTATPSTDILPTAIGSPTGAATAASTPATLRPTITPAGVNTTAPQIAPSFTPAVLVTNTPAQPAPLTPGLSDVQPSPSPTSTLDPALRTTPTGISVEENPCIYVVQPNDTLFSIAREHEVELDALIAVNGTQLPYGENTVLQIGMQLMLPGCGTPTPAATDAGGAPQPTTTPAGLPTTHTVQSGETIYSIARQYGVDPNAIIAANNITNPSLIYPGQVLTIPAP